MQLNKNYTGKYYRMLDGAVYNFNDAGQMAYAGGVTDSIVTVLLTGYWLTSPRGNTMYQTTSGGYIDLSDGWEEFATGSVTNYSDTQAQKLVNKIISANRHIVENNCVCARFSGMLTTAEKETLYSLQQRAEARNTSIIKDGLCKEVQTAAPDGYMYLQTYLESFMQGGGVGIAISTVVTIVIIATVAAGLGTAAYYAYREMKDEAENDVKFSDELTKKLLERLSPELYEQLLDETKGIVTKARLKQKLSGLGTFAKYALAICGGAAAYIFLKKYFKNNQ